MKLIVGLGNPGDNYTLTRHNIGFLTIDALCKAIDAKKGGQKFKSLYYEGVIHNTPVKLIKPQTFMNLSGEAIQLISAFYKIPPHEILVIYDDFDLPFPTLRLRRSGSAGTHNGMKSIVQTLKTQPFPRLRMGIGPKPPEYDTAGFVLSPFSKGEQDALPQLLNRAVACIESLYTDGLDKTMSVFNAD